MERFVMNKLVEWKNSPYRKPLILKGVRQVGKTWLLKEFGKSEYKNTAYINFENNSEFKEFFETTKNLAPNELVIVRNDCKFFTTGALDKIIEKCKSNNERKFCYS